MRIFHFLLDEQCQVDRARQKLKTHGDILMWSSTCFEIDFPHVEIIISEVACFGTYLRCNCIKAVTLQLLLQCISFYVK